MDRECLQRLRKKYYPMFTFNDGLMTALIILTVIIVRGVPSANMNAAQMLRAASKLFVGWFGTIWVAGGSQYLAFLFQRLTLTRILRRGFTAVPCRAELSVREGSFGFRKRYICTAVINGISYHISTQIYNAAVESGKGFLIIEKNGRGVVFMPSE